MSISAINNSENKKQKIVCAAGGAVLAGAGRLYYVCKDLKENETTCDNAINLLKQTAALSSAPDEYLKMQTDAVKKITKDIRNHMLMTAPFKIAFWSGVAAGFVLLLYKLISGRNKNK